MHDRLAQDAAAEAVEQVPAQLALALVTAAWAPHPARTTLALIMELLPARHAQRPGSSSMIGGGG